MKKGRPAYTLSVLLREDLGARIREVIFSETSAIGMREQRVTKHALEREFARVEVRGERHRRQDRQSGRHGGQCAAGV
ncbi:MAG: nickel insertion protein [Nocardioidaceae bacterium]